MPPLIRHEPALSSRSHERLVCPTRMEVFGIPVRSDFSDQWIVRIRTDGNRCFRRDSNRAAREQRSPTTFGSIREVSARAPGR